MKKFLQLFNLSLKYDRKVVNYRTDSSLAKAADIFCQIMLALMAVALFGLCITIAKSVNSKEIGYIIIVICFIVANLCFIASYVSYFFNWLCSIIIYRKEKETITSKKFNTVIFIINIITFVLMNVGVIIQFILLVLEV